MKSLLIVLVLTAGAFLGWRAFRAPARAYQPIVVTEPVATPASVTGEIPPGYALLAYDVQGMHCGACSTRLHQSLAALDFVERAGVDHVLGRAEVLVPEGTDEAPLFAVFEAEQFPAQRNTVP